MNREEQFKRNNDLFKLFMEQTLSVPEFSEGIPEDSELIFLPEYDPELYRANLDLARQAQAEDKRVIHVKVGLIREVRTVFVPKMELVKPI
ncbi:MAG: hypothetical protein DDT26_01524 [Dehalococcoidia bacterium]|nr:hypothetical protein [Chloroflexota bacterium]